MDTALPQSSLDPRGSSGGAARLRLGSLGLAALICFSLAYLGMTRRFGVITDLFNDPAPIMAEIEVKPPPPVVRPPTTPPPIQHAPPADAPAPPTPTLFEVATNVSPDPSPIITNATFLERPSGRDFERYFPQRALQRGQSGRVVMDCAVAASGRLDCSVIQEDPQGWGFGDASLLAARHFRVAPATADGHPTSGGHLRVPMTWRAL